MSVVLSSSNFYYTSGGGGQVYSFTVSVFNGNVSVKDIKTPTGRLCHYYDGLPNSVLQDIQYAISQVENILVQSSAINGTVTFSSETSKIVSFPTPLASATYRVHLEIPDYITARPISKTTDGFIIETGATYTGTIGFDVFI